MNKYDLVLVGTGFSSSFFLLGFLKRRPKARVLVLERGPLETHAWKMKNRRLMDISGVVSAAPFAGMFQNRTEKPWIFTPTFGGSSNCWYACTPRFLPSDFRLKTDYGRGSDWPMSYDDLERYYCDAEELMGVAGSSDSTPFPRSRPYPQPPHRVNDIDRAMKRAYPDSYFVMPAARPTRATKNRPRCCASAVCNLCPIDSKFSVQNELKYLYEQEGVTLSLDSQAIALRIENGSCKEVAYLEQGREKTAAGEIVALGANPIFNSHILLNSGVSHPLLGRGLGEQVAYSCSILLNGIENFSGSTIATGHGYMFYDGPHRREHSACLIENFNKPLIRFERGKYRQTAFMKMIFEDIPQPENRVKLSEDRTRPAVEYRGYSAYVEGAIKATQAKLGRLLAPLPVEDIQLHPVHPTEGHILGTAPMGGDPQTSLVDRYQKLHAVNNVYSLGGSSFPTMSPANPTLTISALSLWTADHL